MPLPSQLADRVDAALRAVVADPAQHLRLGLRRSIWSALEPHIDGTRSTVGKRRRGQLALLSVMRARELWSDDAGSHLDDVLALAERLLQHPGDATDHGDDVGRYWAAIDEGTGSRDPASKRVELAAVAALRAVIFDELFDPSVGDDGTTDDDIDPYSADAAFWAAAAFAGGTQFDPQSDSERRGEFWRWWLTEAIAAAWRTESAPG